ncbi:hypothetical protein NLG97_g3980 [Lecanicillium saksenae]|uniref:Uncharacterized protein n=1 Tax=Lecanicillium saksenae TaxID=468837 RepID=A0ACC1QWP5_9HYPO|nr:hypothetical protein NLG97_g3980 [Lecanicillium saksenae]
MSRGSSPQPPQHGTTAATSDAHTHLLSQSTRNQRASGSHSNMTANDHSEDGYGAVKHGDADNGKRFSDDEIREVNEDRRTSETSSVHVQDGVKRVEAITTVWSKNTMIVMFALLFLVSFVDTLLQSVQGALTPYVTSSFQAHSLLAVTESLAFIFGGVCTLAIAKVIDIWGRAEGFTVMIVLIIVGMVMKAACVNVEMYTAANTIYWVGHIGVQYVIQIMYADMTTLRNRLLLFGVLQLPTIAATFGGPKIADLFYTHSNFRWAFGAFCIIMPVFAAPVVIVFFLSKRKAQREGRFPERAKTRTYLESAKHYAIEFDVVGMLLTIFGWSLLLLPFNLATKAPHGWRTGYIIAMIVLGVALLAAFVVWEKYFATVQYFPFKHLKDMSVLGASLVYGFMFISIFTWDTYYYSYLMVVHDLSITNASYVLNSFSLISSIIGPLTGLLVRYYGYYKWPSVSMTPFAVLGTALLIHFRNPSSHVGLLVMCQLFSGIYSGVWAATSQLSVMANVSHQETAVALALWGLFGSIGAAIGQAIAGGIWTNVLPQQLVKNLPDDLKPLAGEIFADITKQLSYPMGSPGRDAIIASYGHVQRIFVIVGCCFLPLAISCLFLWKNINVKSMQSAERRKKVQGSKLSPAPEIETVLNFALRCKGQKFFGEFPCSGTLDSKLPTIARPPPSAQLLSIWVKILSSRKPSLDMHSSQALTVRDPSVTFEEYFYWAKLTRSKEAEANAARLKGVGDGAIDRTVETRKPSEKTSPATVQPAELGEDPASSREDDGQAMMQRATREEWARAERGLRTTSWGAVFFLITTDIIGPMTTPWAFAQTGYGPGVALYTVFGALAAYSGYIIWTAYIGLDSEKYPLLTFGDLYYRLFGAVPRHCVNFMLSFQLMLIVAVLILQSGQGISQISQGRDGINGGGLCFIVCMLIYTVAGLLVGQVKTLRRVSWLANLCVWLNVTVLLICIGVVVHYPPNFKATEASYGKEFGPGPIRTYAGQPPPGMASGGTGFVASLNGLNQAVYSYGGCMVFVAFMAEMRHPMDFWKSLLCGQAFIYVVYIFFGLFVYSYQGQFAFNPVMQGLSPYTFQTATNVLYLVSSVISATLYSNIGFKVIYMDIFQEIFKFPPLTEKKGKIAWAFCMPLFWIIAFVVAAAVPQLSYVSGFIGAFFILSLTYTAPAILALGFQLKRDAMVDGEERFDPETRRYSYIDTGLRRHWRAYKKRPLVNTFNIIFVLSGLVTTALGVYSSVEGLIGAFNGKSVATSFGCRAPV